MMGPEQLAKMQTASTWSRLFAYAIDSLVGSLCLLPVWLQLIRSYFKQGQLSVDLHWLLLCGLLVIFYRWIFLYFMGGTPGKLILGLRVVPAAHPGSELTLVQSFLRVLTDSLSIFFGQALRALALLRFDRTHVSDWVAETRVVQFTPRGHFPKRRILLALVVALFSFWSTFNGLYHSVKNMEISEGQLFIYPPPQ